MRSDDGNDTPRGGTQPVSGRDAARTTPAGGHDDAATPPGDGNDAATVPVSAAPEGLVEPALSESQQARRNTAVPAPPPEPRTVTVPPEVAGVLAGLDDRELVGVMGACLDRLTDNRLRLPPPVEQVPLM